MHISAHDPVFKLVRLVACAVVLAEPHKKFQSTQTLEGYHGVTSECLIFRMESLRTQLRVRFGAHAYFRT